jgi:hypothetical protein
MGELPDFSPDPIQNLKHTAFVDMIIFNSIQFTSFPPIQKGSHGPQDIEHVNSI